MQHRDLARGERLGQGREKVKLFLKQHPEIFEAIDARVRKELGISTEAEVEAATETEALPEPLGAAETGEPEVEPLGPAATTEPTVEPLAPADEEPATAPAN